MKKLLVCLLILTLVQLVAFSADMPGMKMPDAVPAQDNVQKEEPPAQQIWTCSMHPQIRSDKPGKCPICGMTLIPVVVAEESSTATSNAVLSLSPSAINLAGIETALVVRKEALAEINLVGKINFNETRNVTISAKFPGKNFYGTVAYINTTFF